MLVNFLCELLQVNMSVSSWRTLSVHSYVLYDHICWWIKMVWYIYSVEHRQMVKNVAHEHRGFGQILQWPNDLGVRARNLGRRASQRQTTGAIWHPPAGTRRRRGRWNIARPPTKIESQFWNICWPFLWPIFVSSRFVCGSNGNYQTHASDTSHLYVFIFYISSLELPYPVIRVTASRHVYFN